MAIDLFKSFSTSLSAPATRLSVITPSDTEDLTLVTRALCVGESGLVRVQTLGGDEADLYIAAGVPFPIRVNRVMATGTTATDIRGLS